ncbi:hypothetical protein SARC_01115 [Sphaeroforma arctica JP610]|uniref:Uncharacterized protein n=1 Tax=Sphaeroforma arctica JP610 TaxID=667725 RepID=A0A0L0GCW8_9EUKA|nr:hypothetical protein SARC_01115 [Sphaeroforma arctica JP610]KNC86736.1 hypothetical protein SARC_01115 [Sphaeroforma arctica JP610]|eukprot:XP_014160638.1 hypothetical protein SARC_01115 [Sphaeroforma arctica JP610]
MATENILNKIYATRKEHPARAQETATAEFVQALIVNPATQTASDAPIHHQKFPNHEDLARTRETVSESFLQALIDNPATSFSCVNFADRLRKGRATRKMACVAEVKRASPSKGDFAPNADAAAQAYRYASGGADGISVLTEPRHFKGQLADLRAVRAMLEDTMTSDTRPCVLRKDFIFDPFQLLEARAYGADSVLLIVKMLSDTLLRSLLEDARKLGMEPLVEVNNTEEMQRALAVGAVVIGVNNRNLTDFQVDLNTTSSLLAMVPENVILMALSGITCRADVALYEAQGVHAILVGESLMRAPDTRVFMRELLSVMASAEEPVEMPTTHRRTRVKVCGLSTVEAALTAATAGADLCGLIFAEKSPRCVTMATARTIVHEVKLSMGHVPGSMACCDDVGSNNGISARTQTRLEILLNTRRPLFVGVFQDQPVDFVNEMVRECQLDLVQLHGSEDNAYANQIVAPCIRVVHVGPDDSRDDVIASITSSSTCQNVALTLLDTKVTGSSMSGGAGVTFDWTLAAAAGKAGFEVMYVSTSGTN